MDPPLTAAFPKNVFPFRLTWLYIVGGNSKGAVYVLIENTPPMFAP
jgi:hypothetical protein